MANTYTLIQSVTVGSGGAASIQFTSIPQTYTDLKLVLSGRRAGSLPTGMYITFNGSTSNFSGIYLYGTGSSAVSGSLARYVGSVGGTDWTASVFNNTEIYIPNYTGSTNKSFSTDNVAENNGTPAGLNIIAGLLSHTAAITSIAVAPDTSDFVQFSSASLYGIKNS